MARFSEYMDYDYLPRKAMIAGLGDAFVENPQGELDYLSAKRFKFQPDDNRGSAFGRFLALQQNPNALMDASMKLPSNFEAFSQIARMGG
jgi:hypothetical protein